MNEIPCTFQYTESKTLLANVFVFGRFGQLSPAAFHSYYSRFDFAVKGRIHISSIVTCLHKNFFLLRWNSCKQRSESSTHGCFRSTVSKGDTLFEHSFLIAISSCIMVNALSSVIFNSSSISRNFNLRSAKTS